MKSRHSSEEVVAAYRETGSVWKAAKRLGLCGQTVHERLVGLGVSLFGHKWTKQEIEELRALAETCTIGEIARRLGRPYAGVACKLSALEISVPRKACRKIPRGAGFDAKSVRAHMKALDSHPGGITKYCRANSISIDLLILAIQRDNSLWWEAYSAARADLPRKECPYCGQTYFPMNAKQETCSRKCQSDRRSDRQYFNGNRRSTIGLAQGICQLCARHDVKGLSSHHVYGKENDPEGNWLVALCPGCHQIISHLAGRRFIEDVSNWENLINLVMLRHSNGSVPGFYTTVEIEPLTKEALEEEMEEAEIDLRPATEADL